MRQSTIFIFIRTLLAGGSEYQSLLLAKALQKNYRVKVILYEGEKIDVKNRRFAEENEIEMVGLHGNPIKKLFACLAVFKRERPESLVNMQPFTNVYGTVLAKAAGIPVVFGGIRSEYIGPLKSFMVRFLHNHIQAATIINSYSARDKLIAKGFDPRKCVVLLNGFENNAGDGPPAPEGREGLRILSVGRFVWQKDYKTAIDAVGKLVRGRPDIDVRFRIIGYGEQESWLRGYIRAADLDGVVEIVINPEALAGHYRWANSYLCTSIIEGTSNAIIEALSYRLPVVATDAGDNRRMIVDGTNGYVCSKGESGQIAARLAELADNALRRRYGEQGYQIYQTSYSFEAFRRNAVSLMNRYLGAKSKA